MKPRVRVKRTGHSTLCWDDGYGCMKPLRWDEVARAHAAGREYVHECGRRIPPPKPTG